MKGHGKNDEASGARANVPGKFVAAKVRAAHASLSQQSYALAGAVPMPSSAPAGAGPPSSAGGSGNAGATVGSAVTAAAIAALGHNLSEKDVQVSEC